MALVTELRLVKLSDFETINCEDIEEVRRVIRETGIFIAAPIEAKDTHVEGNKLILNKEGQFIGYDEEWELWMLTAIEVEK